MNKVLSAINNVTRLQLIECLAHKPKSVSEMIAICGMSQSSISQHLSKLRQAGLVTPEKKGKTVYYRLTYPVLTEVTGKLQHFVKEARL